MWRCSVGCRHAAVRTDYRRPADRHSASDDLDCPPDDRRRLTVELIVAAIAGADAVGDDEVDVVRTDSDADGGGDVEPGVVEIVVPAVWATDYSMKADSNGT